MRRKVGSGSTTARRKSVATGEAARGRRTVDHEANDAERELDHEEGESGLVAVREESCAFEKADFGSASEFTREQVLTGHQEGEGTHRRP